MAFATVRIDGQELEVPHPKDWTGHEHKIFRRVSDMAFADLKTASMNDPMLLYGLAAVALARDGRKDPDWVLTLPFSKIGNIEAEAEDEDDPPAGAGAGDHEARPAKKKRGTSGSPPSDGSTA